MEPAESKSSRHFWFSIFKSMFRLGGAYGLWFVGGTMGEPVLQTVGVFFGIAEILGILEELQGVDALVIRVKMNYYKGVEYAERNNR